MLSAVNSATSTHYAFEEIVTTQISVMIVLSPLGDSKPFKFWGPKS